MLRIGAVVWGVTDIDRAVRFWTQALDYRVKGRPDETWAILVSHDGSGVQLSLSRVTSERARRHHLDLFTHDQEAEVKRLLVLGASRVEWRYEDGADYVVLADLDGNRFCVVQK